MTAKYRPGLWPRTDTSGLLADFFPPPLKAQIFFLFHYQHLEDQMMPTLVFTEVQKVELYGLLCFQFLCSQSWEVGVQD